MLKVASQNEKLYFTKLEGGLATCAVFTVNTTFQKDQVKVQNKKRKS